MLEEVFLMKAFLLKVWREPAALGAVVVVAVNAALFLPDWRKALASAGASIATALGIRSRTSTK